MPSRYGTGELYGFDFCALSPARIRGMGEIQAEEGEEDAVGKIDGVLVNNEGGTLRWCALEFQAVYFSGKSMENDFKAMREWAGPGVPFPAAQRQPDFRSSGPKRLMPQLQIKAPTISQSALGSVPPCGHAPWPLP
ncbi:MAG: NotI family restriction endonuclease [Limisphaerales bacterium]